MRLSLIVPLLARLRPVSLLAPQRDARVYCGCAPANVTCLETVQREFQPARGKARHLDTIRLEILSDGKQELYASPGDRRFAPDHPITYAGSGVLGNGVFGLYLKDILVTGNVSYEYKGEEQIGGRRLARYDHRLPVLWSGYVIHTTEGSGKYSWSGTDRGNPRGSDRWSGRAI